MTSHENKPRSDTKCSVSLSVTHAAQRRIGEGRGESRGLTAGELSPSVVTRFWAKVKKTDGCWLWMGHLARGGYGLAYAGKHPSGRGSINHYAHRIAHALVNGDVPAGAVVMHSCDVPDCVNPEHLSIGTQQENIADRDLRGRTKKTSRSIRKIDTQGVHDIRTRRDISARDFARQFGVCPSHINRIRRGEKRKVD